MSEAALFKDMAVVLIAAGVSALAFYYLKQPVVLGYLLAGYLVGPFSVGPSFVGDGAVMGFLGELGIIFLLFALGLEFNLKKLKKVGATAMLAGTIEIALMLWLGYSIGRFFGWSTFESIFLGAVMSISSTTIIVKVLAERGQKDEDWAQVAFGILIIEDILAVLILTALSGAAASGNFQPELLGALLYKLAIFLGAALILGLLVIPRFVDRLAALRIEEVSVIVAVGMALGMALLAAGLGFSAGLGAFVAGALMGESPRVRKIEHKIEPIRDLFTAIFFVWVGAQLDPAVLVANWGLVAAVTVGVLVGKVGGVTLATFLAGQAPPKALRVGMTLGQIGEFGFVIAAVGLGLGVTSPALLPVAIAVSVITAFLTPYLVRASPHVVNGLSSFAPVGLRAYLNAYGAWVRRLRRTDQRDQERAVAKGALVTALLAGTVILAIFGIGVAFVDDVADTVNASLPFGMNVVAVEWLALSLLATPFMYVWFRAMQRLVVSLARMAVPQRLRTCECTTTERLLRRTFGVVATCMTGAVVLLFGSIVVDSILGIVIVVGVGVAVSTAALGQTLGRFQREVERTLARVMEDEVVTGAHTKDEALHLIENSQAWGAASRELMLPAVSGGTGRTLAELNLRALTGASVASVKRAGSPSLVVQNPGSELRLGAGDRVLLIGEEEAIIRAEEILLGRDLGIEGGATEIHLASGSILEDAPLDVGLILARTGARVLVVRRAGVTLAAEPELVLRAGDVLVVSGSGPQVAAARAEASPAPAVAPEAATGRAPA